MPTDTGPDVMTAKRAVALAVILDCAQDGKRVARVADHLESGVIYATARWFNRIGDDMREWSMDVTTREGMQLTWAVRELMDEYGPGLFRDYDWS